MEKDIEEKSQKIIMEPQATASLASQTDQSLNSSEQRSDSDICPVHDINLTEGFCEFCQVCYSCK